MLANIGPNGMEVPGAGAGIVVASPSKEDPDYFFTWTRDAALTLQMLTDEFLFGREELEVYMNDFIRSQAILQTVSNPSGSFLPQGLGLGEPKYQVNGSRFNGAWGRPQRDGPALRATSMIIYAKHLLEEGETDRVRDVIWPVIQNDLSYVGQYWNETGFDLWEEVLGSSFFTIQVSYRSLIEGAQLASMIDVDCVACNQAPNILCFLQSFWTGEYIDANINVNEGRTGLDSNAIVGPITIFDVKASCDNPTFQPCSSKVLANFKQLMDTFRAEYSINSGIPRGQGIAVGRYSEDVYQGGQPWYMHTFGAAELLYDAVAQWENQGKLTIDTLSLPFWKEIYPAAKTGTYSRGIKGNTTYNKLIQAVWKYADSFVKVGRKYTPEDGSLAEQYNRDTGVPLSARDLTWSYASFLSMSRRRDGFYPPSWNASSAVLPEVCVAGSTQGVYAPAIAAGAPNVTAPCQVAVSVELNATTYFGENIYVVGSVPELGNWNPAEAAPLDAGGYTPERPLWRTTLFLEAAEDGEVREVEYKFVRFQDCGQDVIWEEGANRRLTIGECGSDGIAVDEAWRGPVGSPGGC